MIETLAAAAFCAPTKSDLQQRDIVILQDPDLRAAIDALFPQAPWIATAPAFLVFCANNRRQRQLHAWHDRPFANDHLDAFFNATVDAAVLLSASSSWPSGPGSGAARSASCAITPPA